MADCLMDSMSPEVLEPLVVDGRSMEPAPEHEHEAWAAIAESLTCDQARHPLSHTSSLGDHNSEPAVLSTRSFLVDTALRKSALCLLLDDVAFDLDDTDALLGAHPCGDELEEHQCVFSDDSNGNTMPKSTHLDSNLWQSNRAAVGLYLDAEDVISAWEAAEDARFGSTCFAADDTQQPGNGRRSARAHAARLVAASEAVAECCLPAGHGANGSPFQSKRFVPFARHLLHSRRAGVDLDALLFHAPGSPSISEDVPAAMRKGQQYQHGRKGGRVPTPTPPCAQRNMQEDGLTRLQRVKRYLEKRRCRDFITRVRYHVRKANAEGRPRFKGRFVKTVGVSGDAAEGVLVPSV